MRPCARAAAPLRALLARYDGLGAAAPAPRAASSNAWPGAGGNGGHGGGPGGGVSASLAAAGGSSTNNMRVLVTGAAGQIGSDLVPFLARRLAPGAVLATDLRPPTAAANAANAATTTATSTATSTTTLDCTDAAAFAALAREHRCTHIVHLAALLSARGEQDPDLAIRVNSRGTEAALAAARAQGAALLLPSTIGVYGLTPEARRAGLPSSDDPEANPGRPRTLYGVTKAYAEGLGGWYARAHGVDFRALRLPGVLSATAPGGGTTDYALHMLERAVEGVMGQEDKRRSAPSLPPYRCFVDEAVALPFMHASDTLRAFWGLLSAPRGALSRAVYNVGAVTATPREWRGALERAAREAVGGGARAEEEEEEQGGSPPPPPPPLLSVEYAPDHRDAIARSWPASLDCSAAARDWGYAPEVAGVDAMARRLLAERLAARRRAEEEAAVVAPPLPPPLQPSAAEWRRPLQVAVAA